VTKTLLTPSGEGTAAKELAKKGNRSFPKINQFCIAMYNQLTLAQRYTISTMRQNGYTYQAIADEINRIEEEAAEAVGLPIPKKRAASTIQREYKRNRSKTGKYNPKVANGMAMERRERIVTNRALRPGVLERAMKLLKEKRWSPEQISGHLRQADL